MKLSSPELPESEIMSPKHWLVLSLQWEHPLSISCEGQNSQVRVEEMIPFQILLGSCIGY